MSYVQHCPKIASINDFPYFITRQSRPAYANTHMQTPRNCFDLGILSNYAAQRVRSFLGVRYSHSFERFRAIYTRAYSVMVPTLLAILSYFVALVFTYFTNSPTYAFTSETRPTYIVLARACRFRCDVVRRFCTDVRCGFP